MTQDAAMTSAVDVRMEKGDLAPVLQMSVQD